MAQVVCGKPNKIYRRLSVTYARGSAGTFCTHITHTENIQSTKRKSQHIHQLHQLPQTDYIRFQFNLFRSYFSFARLCYPFDIAFNALYRMRGTQHTHDTLISSSHWKIISFSCHSERLIRQWACVMRAAMANASIAVRDKCLCRHAVSLQNDLFQSFSKWIWNNQLSLRLLLEKRLTLSLSLLLSSNVYRLSEWNRRAVCTHGFSGFSHTSMLSKPLIPIKFTLLLSESSASASSIRRCRRTKEKLWSKQMTGWCYHHILPVD